LKNTKIVHFTLGICILFLFNACGSNSANKNSSLNTTADENMLTNSHKIGQLKVSSDNRMLSYEDNTGFFWMADTAWEIATKFENKDNRNQLIDTYMQDRQTKGFSVIQTSALMHRYLLNHAAFSNEERKAPKYKGANFSKPVEKYWEMIDYIIKSAKEHNLFVALLPAWNDVILEPKNASIYGTWIAKRYKDKENIIWIVGGDSNAKEDTSKKIWNNLGNAIKKVVGTKQLISYHPSGGKSSSEWFHDEPWLDFNMIQSGHCDEITKANKTLTTHRKATTIPIIDAEPRYEEIVRCFGRTSDGNDRITSDEVREIAYTQLFSGAFGHTYGHHSIWQMHEDNSNTNNTGGIALQIWKEALDDEGATYMGYVAKLMRSRPLLNRVPDPSIIKTGHAISTRGVGYAFIYLPKGGEITVNLGKISGTQVKAWWFNPKTGDAQEIKTYPNEGTQLFNTNGQEDMVLVLDDISKSYDTPGI